MSEQTLHRKDKAKQHTKQHMIWAMGAGLIPLPVADLLGVSAIQINLVRRLCAIYDIEFSKSRSKALITAITGSGLARLGAGAVKFIPGAGSVIGGLTMSVLSGASTYAVGEVFAKHFETGGTFLDFDPSRLRKYYDQKFEKGKKMANRMRDQKEQDKPFTEEHIPKYEDRQKTPLEQLEKLADMREKGLLTEEEFEELKRKIIQENDE